jgi:predicted PurR-regulated permease PerM
MNTPPVGGSPSDAAARTARRWASGALYAVLSLVALWTARDFLPAIAWAVVIAISIWPLVRRLDQKPPFRERPILLAVTLTILIAIVVIVPLLMLTIQVLSELDAVKQWIRDLTHTGIPVPDLVSHLPFGATQITRWWQDNLAIPLDASPLASSLKAHGTYGSTAVSVTREVGGRLVHAAITLSFVLITLFVILARGPQLGTRLTAAARRAFGEDGTELLERMAQAARGTVVGLVVVGIGEGVLLGIAYFFAGLPRAPLIGLITAIAAMLPFCAPLVFLAAAAWLLVNGSTAAAMAVAITGVIVVFTAEHFVRPVLISGSTRLPFLLVLIGILGGAQTFGLLGLFIGPALMTILMVLWETWVR